ncbi:MAG: Ig-like domain-containing protein [Pseudonocardiaceae bacterium]
MRKKKTLTLLLSGVLLVVAAIGAAMLTIGAASPTGGMSIAAPPASARQVTPTSTALATSSASPVAQGTPVQLTATVTPAAATGTVQFKDGSTNIGEAVTVRNGTASQTTSTLAVGSHQLTAVFTPANPAAYSPSTSPAVPFVISGATATSTALTTSLASPAAQGTSMTLTATVTPAAATGTVQFKDGATNIGDAVNVSNGTASQTTTLAVGSHQLTAVFTPTNPALFSPSTSPAVPFVISGATATSTTLSASSTASPVVLGSSVTLTATVTPAEAAGTVQFRDGATNIGDAVTVNNGTATTTTTTLTVGSHELTAVFTPTNTALYSASTSPAETFVVSGPTATSTTLATDPGSPVLEDTEVALTATVNPSAAAGTVQFRDGNSNIGNAVTVNNGTATTTTTLGVGSHQLTAVFTPTNTALYAPSTSQAETFVVEPRPLVEAVAAVVPEEEPDAQRGSERPGIVSPVAVIGEPATLVVSTLTQGVRWLTEMFTTTTAYDPSPESTNSVIVEIGGELLDRIITEIQDGFDR